MVTRLATRLARHTPSLPALGDQSGVADGFRRFVLQAKSALDQTAPAKIAGGRGEGNA
jgi:hypothetical protein